MYSGVGTMYTMYLATLRTKTCLMFYAWTRGNSHNITQYNTIHPITYSTRV